jgi:hypothetical protein
MPREPVIELCRTGLALSGGQVKAKRRKPALDLPRQKMLRAIEILRQSVQHQNGMEKVRSWTEWTESHR